MLVSFLSNSLCQHCDHKKTVFVMSTSQRLQDYCVTTRNPTHKDTLPPLLQSMRITSDMKNKQKHHISLNRCLFKCNTASQMCFQDSEVLDSPSPIRFLFLLLCFGSDPCWIETLTNYHVCPRCVLWRHRKRGGNWGEWYAALQGWLSVYWP